LLGPASMHHQDSTQDPTQVQTHQIEQEEENYIGRPRGHEHVRDGHGAWPPLLGLRQELVCTDMDS
jgi:hypothetical protein